MCIIAKIEEIQIALMGEEFPKSGFNKYTKKRYHELKDILPPVVRECHKRDLVLLYNFTQDQAILDVADKHNVDNYYRFTLPMPEIKEMGAMNIIQSLGADTTYLKRYLLRSAFLILEDDVADAINPAVNQVDDDSSDKEPIIKEKKQAKDSIPTPVSQALIKLDKAGKKITKASVFTAMDKEGMDSTLRKRCIDYIQNNVED